MDGNTNGMKEEMREMRGEMQNMGRGLQAGIMAMARDKTRTAGIMAPPRAGMNELKGSATAVRPAVGAGEDSLIRGTCRTRSVRMTEKVTVTQRGKLNGVTETCETGHEVTTERIKCIETREIEGELDRVKEDTHTQR